MEYLLYDVKGKILGTGSCQRHMLQAQAKNYPGSVFVMEGTADSRTQKVVDNKVVNKTSEEIEAERLPEIPFEKRQAYVTNEQWQAALKRIEKLENED